jgi:hypothetical protein
VRFFSLSFADSLWKWVCSILFCFTILFIFITNNHFFLGFSGSLCSFSRFCFCFVLWMYGNLVGEDVLLIYFF